MDIQDIKNQVKNLRRIKRPTVQDTVDAANLFISEWCQDCKVGLSLIPAIDSYPVDAPCPKEVWETCPLLIKIKEMQQRKEDFYASIRPADKDTDSSTS